MKGINGNLSMGHLRKQEYAKMKYFNDFVLKTLIVKYSHYN